MLLPACLHPAKGRRGGPLVFLALAVPGSGKEGGGMEGERDRGNLSLVIHSSSLPPRTLTRLVYNQMRSKHARDNKVRMLYQ